MELTPFKFSANVPETVLEIIHNTILSDLPLVNKRFLLCYAFENEKDRRLYIKEKGVFIDEIWRKHPKKALDTLDAELRSCFIRAIEARNSEKCKGLLGRVHGSQKQLLETWYNSIKDEDSLDHCVLEEMKKRLLAFNLCHGQEANNGGNSITVSESGQEAMNWEENERQEATDSNKNHSSTETPSYGQSDFHGAVQQNSVSWAHHEGENFTNGSASEHSSGTFSADDALPHNHLETGEGIPLSPEQQRVETTTSQPLISSHEELTENVASASPSSDSIYYDATAEQNENSLQEDIPPCPTLNEQEHDSLQNNFLNKPLSVNSSLTQHLVQSSRRQAGTEATKIQQDFDTDNIPEEDIQNVLLLGETGVGKSTFINSFTNYIKFDSMEEALEAGPVLLMDATFSTADSDGVRTVKVTIQATTGERGALNSTNENTETANSTTQEPLIHKIVWTAADGRTKLLRIIDTPGVNDTRGLAQDTENFRKVLYLIQKIGKLHAICLLLKPNESIMTAGFRRSLDYFFTRLHCNALRNILFCFTNTRSNFYRPGNTFTLLERYFADMKSANGIAITLDTSNVFCFENECFRYMCLLMKDSTREDVNHQQYTASWQHNVPEVKRLLERIETMTPHVTEDTTKMETIGSLLVELTSLLVGLTESIEKDRKQVPHLETKVKRTTEKIEALKKNLYKTKIMLTKQILSKPQVVCTAEKCTESITLNNGKTLNIPKQACLAVCCLPEEESVIIVSSFCTKCGCHKRYHKQKPYKIIKEIKDETIIWFSMNVVNNNLVLDEGVSKDLDACISEADREENELTNLKCGLTELDQEVKNLMEACAELSAFLLYSSLKAGADPYSTHLAMLIRKETERMEGSINAMKMETIMKQHRKNVQNTVQDVKTGRKTPLTYVQVKVKIYMLCALKHSGHLISEIVRYSNGLEQNGRLQAAL